MYSSPVTPAGTGHSHSSSTNTWVLAIGAPIGGVLAPGTYSHAVESTDVSVGPYRLCSWAGTSSAHRAATHPGSASPLQITRRSRAHAARSAPARNASSIDGTKC